MTKHITIVFLLLWGFLAHVKADVAPSPINAVGISVREITQIQMVKEDVRIDIFPDYSKVRCQFLMYSPTDTTIQIGFPEMRFHLFTPVLFREDDKYQFLIKVNRKTLNDESLVISEELDSLRHLYDSFLSIPVKTSRRQEKIDSLYEEFKTHYSQMKSNQWPWFVWEEHFAAHTTKQIDISYKIPNGILYYGDKHRAENVYRYTKYLLSTGTNWAGCIKEAKVSVRMHLGTKRVKEIHPDNYQHSKSIYRWSFIDLEPTEKDDIEILFQ